ncbi:hypothetical protein [Alteribacter natronophilus]|uniref:hypothetical protein n=1 Tax=Alteribacter natronophilus TaxID=2583810 RepID=UPI00110D6C18|nr:hypothetical protein [Alteribacter natronophilus]TMW71764.1 hypothetical protein FGB90_12115 [Alteribacter natronophilus]
MLKYKAVAVLLAVMVTTAAGCSFMELTGEERAERALVENLSAAPADINYSNDYFSIYKPDSLNVEYEDSYNLELEGEDRTYLVFLGDQAGYENKGEMMEANGIEGTPELAEIRTGDEDSGYVVFDELDEDTVKVITGINGVKGTVITSKDRTGAEAELLFEMVNSVQTK